VTEGAGYVLRYVNPAFCRLCGQDPESLVGSPLVDTLPAPHHDGVLALLDSVYRTGAAASARDLAQSGRGPSPVYWSYTVWPEAGDGGAPRRLLILIADTTEQGAARRLSEQTADVTREINQRLVIAGVRADELATEARQEIAERTQAAELLQQRARALEEEDRLKSTLLSLISHDLKTPLTGIKSGIANLRRGGSTAFLRPEASELLGDVEAKTDQLNTLINALLDLSRIQAGAWQPSLEWYDLVDILGTVLSRFDEANALRIRICVAEDAPMVRVDGVQIAQVLWNLLETPSSIRPAARRSP